VSAFKKRMIALAREKLDCVAGVDRPNLETAYDYVKAEADRLAVFSERGVASLFLLYLMAGPRILQDPRLTACLSSDDPEPVRIDEFMECVRHAS